MLKLQFKDQRQPPIWLVESVTTIGSDPKNHVVIKDEGVDAQHAEIRKEDDALYLSDLDSYQGTLVNGNKIKAKFQLRAGDAVSIGGVELLIVEPQAAGEKKEPAAAKPRSDWSIMALSGPLKGKSIPIHGSMVFGRSSSCDIQINDAHMSRRHAEINLKGGVLRLVDLQSSNGTMVNGKTIGEQALKPGDKISFDHLTFLVAGPLGAGGNVVEEEEEDDEATVFRAAPIPRAPTPPKPSTPSIPQPSNTRGGEPSAEPQPAKGKASMIVGGVVLVVAIAAGALLMVLQ